MKNFEIGQRAEHKRVFNAQDLAEYAAITGGESTAADERSFVPAPLLGGMFSYLLGTVLPGRGTNYLKQKLTFRAPAFAGEELTATIEIVRLRPEKKLVNLRTTCANESGNIVCQGEALVLVKEMKSDLKSDE